jgi:hypothetical protein
MLMPILNQPFLMDALQRGIANLCTMNIINLSHDECLDTDEVNHPSPIPCIPETSNKTPYDAALGRWGTSHAIDLQSKNAVAMPGNRTDDSV